jgi:nickel transport protein
MNARSLILVCVLQALLLGTVGTPSAQQPAPTDRVPVAASQPAAQNPDPSAALLPPGMEKAFEKILDRKLAPISRVLAEMQEQRVRPTDVLGGLGYIFGLVGVAAYFKRRPGGPSA